MRSHPIGYVIVVAQGCKVAEPIAVVCDDDDTWLPNLARVAQGEVVEQIEALEGRAGQRACLVRHLREDNTALWLVGVPGIGGVGATALAEMLAIPHGDVSVRLFATSLDLT